MKLQLFLSRQGVCSRRKALEMVQQGRVKVNGKIIVEPSVGIDPKKDQVVFNGKRVAEIPVVYVLLNKPPGYVTTKADRFAPKTVLDLLPQKFKTLHPVGRLDKDTEGLLLLTNDGDLTHHLTHPKFDVQKTYFVKIDGELNPAGKRKLERGILLDGKKTAPSKIRNLKKYKTHSEFLLTIHEGRRRQIRLMLAKLRLRVVYLKRIAQGSIKLGSLALGEFRHLTKKEVQQLKALLPKTA